MVPCTAARTPVAGAPLGYILSLSLSFSLSLFLSLSLCLSLSLSLCLLVKPRTQQITEAMNVPRLLPLF